MGDNKMTYKTYRFHGTTAAEGVMRVNDDGSESFIPNDPENADWKNYLAWKEEGNKPEDYDAPITTKTKVAEPDTAPAHKPRAKRSS